MDRYAKFAREKKLVSIRRGDIDQNAIQGFVLGYSAELVLIQYVADFILDGLMVLRTADITEIKCDATCKFQKDLLIAEGLFQQVPFDIEVDLRDWKSVVTQFSRQYKFIILEDEGPDADPFRSGRSGRSPRAASGCDTFQARPTGTTGPPNCRYSASPRARSTPTT